MIEVPRRGIAIGKQEAFDALSKAMGGMSRELAAMLLSLAWIETGGGTFQNYNPGNLTAGPKYTGKVWRPPWYPEPSADATQRTKDLHAAMLKGTAPSAFRAYDTLAQGMSDWVAALKHSFPEVLQAAEQGNPETFRQALSQKYSHDYRNTQSTATFAKLKKGFDPIVAGLHSSHGVFHKVVWGVAGLGLVGVAWGAWRHWRRMG